MIWGANKREYRVLTYLNGEMSKYINSLRNVLAQNPPNTLDVLAQNPLNTLDEMYWNIIPVRLQVWEHNPLNTLDEMYWNIIR